MCNISVISRPWQLPVTLFLVSLGLQRMDHGADYGHRAALLSYDLVSLSISALLSAFELIIRGESIWDRWVAARLSHTSIH